MAVKSSFMGEKSSFRLFGKIEFPSKRTKKPLKQCNQTRSSSVLPLRKSAHIKHLDSGQTCGVHGHPAGRGGCQEPGQEREVFRRLTGVLCRCRVEHSEQKGDEKADGLRLS